MKINLGLDIVIVILAFVLGGCSSVETINYESKNNMIVYSIDKIPESLINKERTTDRENDVICGLFEGLVELNKSGDVIPSLCQGWKVSDDGLEYIFKLREDIKWSSGEQITSFDFVDYFKYILSADNEDYMLDELYVIQGAKDYKDGLCTFDNVKIQATDNKTIVIDLNTADKEFLKKLTKPVYRLRDINEPLSNYKDNYSSIRYTGPYIIDSVSTNDITLKRNDYYLDDTEGIEKIKIKEQQSIEEDFAAYNLGKIDILASPPLSSLNQGTMYTTIDHYLSNTVKILIFNSENSIISDTRFRHGLFDGIFLEILDSYMIKYSVGTWAVNNLAYNDLLNRSLNLTKNYEVDKKLKFKENAKKLLSQLDTRKKTISLVAKNTAENKIIYEFISNILQEKYKMSCEIILLKDEELKNYLKERNFDIYIDDLNLATYQLESDYDITELGDILKSDYSIMSLYYKNFLWCKSSNIECLYIDDNGNLIFKYTKI